MAHVKRFTFLCLSAFLLGAVACDGGGGGDEDAGPDLSDGHEGEDLDVPPDDAVPEVPDGTDPSDAGDVPGDEAADMGEEEEVATRVTKWHPGHYMLVYDDAGAGVFATIADEPNFPGVQKRYNWYELEPSEDAYDFSEIRLDLEALEPMGKRLVIQFQDKDFGGTDPVPQYVIDNGGMAVDEDTPTRRMAKVWLPWVMDREIALLRAMAAEFDLEPFIEAVNFTETSVIVSPPPADYNHEDYRDQLIRRAQESRAAFAHTVVIQFSNWWTQGAYDYLHAALAGCAEAGVGIGGPDIHPGSGIEAYVDYCPNSGVVPLGCAAQTSSYSGDWTVEELYDWGVGMWPEGLCLNYFFWLRRQDDAAAFHFDPDVIDYVNSRDGGVYDTACPANIAPCGDLGD